MKINWYKILFIFTLGILGGWIAKDELSKPDEVTNIKQDIKNKKTSGRVNSEPVINTVEPKAKKKKFWRKIFKKKNNEKSKN